MGNLKTNKQLKFLLSFGLLLFSVQGLLAQDLNVTFADANTASNMLVNLAKTGIHISNATFTGATGDAQNIGQLGSFTSTGSNFPIKNGVLLTTGLASFAQTIGTSMDGNEMHAPNSSVNNFIYSSELNSLQAGGQHATCFLEFDFTAEGQYVNLNYVFASEEYNDQITLNGGIFHDQMGIFISGPSITSVTNIAKIGTSDVSIKTVNGNTNSSSYINNCSNVNSNCQGSGSVVSINDLSIPYNGFTKKLSTDYKLPACDPTKVYHMKIAITNIADDHRDSGVFLELGSLRTEFEMNDIVATPSPVCIGSSVNLSIPSTSSTSSHSGTLGVNTWNTGAIGSNINVVATTSPVTYTCTCSVDGCSRSKSITIQGQPNNNTKPYTNGVNNSGEFNIYVNEGQTTCVNIPSFDHENDLVTISSTNNPPGSTFNHDASPQQIGTFCWATNLGTVGSYNFDVKTNDNHCSALSGSEIYTVSSICRNCNVDVYYENRSPGNNPLPTFTKAGRSIIAGYSVDPNQTDGDVYCSGVTTEFKAGLTIGLLPGFHADPGFFAHIDPSTCVTDCQDCCDRFTGIRTEPIANVFSPNGDGIYDVWQVNDFANPHCAYNGKQFDLTIFQLSAPVYHQTGGDGTTCCPFISYTPGNPNVISSIHWDGWGNAGTAAGHKQLDGTYFYVLDISGCGSTQHYTGNINIFGSSGLAVKPKETNINNNSITSYQNQITSNSKEARKNESNSNNTVALTNLKLYPNPAINTVSIVLENTNEMDEKATVNLTIENLLGTIVKEEVIKLNQVNTIDIKDIPAGTYFVKARLNTNEYKTRLVIIQ